jgi:hypothetical protein
MQRFTMPKGKLRETIRANIVAFLDQLPEDKEWRVEIYQAKRARSIQQCRYLNGIAYKLLSDATGYERDDISEYMCGAYWGWRDKLKPGKVVARVPIRTTTTDEHGKRSVLSKIEFAEFVAYVQRFGAKHGVYIPEPE